MLETILISILQMKELQRVIEIFSKKIDQFKKNLFVNI